MSTPTGDSDFLKELELNVRTELTLAETSTPEDDGVPLDEWVPDTDTQRYEIRLRTLLGAVETMEDGSRPGPGTEAESQ